MEYNYQSRQKLVEAYKGKWKRKLILASGDTKEAMEQMEKFGQYRPEVTSFLKGVEAKFSDGASLRLPNLCGKNIKSWLTFMRAKRSPRTFIISLISLTSFPIPTVFTADRCVPNRICRAWSMSSGCCMHAG